MEPITKDEEKYFDYLDGLRESGVISMFDARPYLVKAFPELSRQESSNVLGKWMKTFSERRKKK